MFVPRTQGKVVDAGQAARPRFKRPVFRAIVRVSAPMAMTIELKPEHEILLQDAVRQGRFHSIDQALDEALHSLAITDRPVLSPAELAAAYRAWAESHPRNIPVLSDNAIIRETIYANGR